MKFVIIGGVAAGMSAASKIKRTNPASEVVVFEKGKFLSYGACGLPYYIGGFNNDYRKMIARTQQRFEEDGIKTHLEHEVISVDTKNSAVMVKDLKTGVVFSEKYDKLLVASGARPIMPPFKNSDLLGVQTLKTLEDGIFIKEYAAGESVKNVVIVGGGYIGIECAEAFLAIGKNVRVIEAGEKILSPFDVEMSSMAEDELKTHGVKLNLNEKVQEFIGDIQVQQVKTDKGIYEAELVIIATGIKPNTDFLSGTGIETSNNGALVVDRQMKTNINNIFAAGDCALCYNPVTNTNHYYALGTVANKCGRIAGENMLGDTQDFIGAIGSAAIKVCEIELFRTGLSLVEAQQYYPGAKSIFIETYDHPPYYPGRTKVYIKVIYDASSKIILGAQLCGKKGAVLRGDIFATAIYSKLKTNELGMVDLAYAPPFANVWDAVQIACNAAK